MNSDIINAIIIGIVQGLTEFLPVSSSGHIEISEAILGNNLNNQQSLLFSIILHFGTALSTIVIFWKDILDLLKGLFKFKNNEETRYILKIILSMLPAVLVGLFLEEQLNTLFNGQILLVGCMLIVTAILLYFADKAKNTNKKVSFSNALLIGIAQAIAVLPGISRSGATISTSVLLGNDRDKAARFSFLMVIPLIFGKVAKDLLDKDFATQSSEGNFILFAGFLASFIAGLFACKWMIKLVKQANLTYFSIYCVIVGVGAIIYSLFFQ